MEALAHVSGHPQDAKKLTACEKSSRERPQELLGKDSRVRELAQLTTKIGNAKIPLIFVVVVLLPYAMSR